MASAKFWMVWQVGWQPGMQTPIIRYEVEVNARIEATRLAQQTHKEVYLLESVARCYPVRPIVEWEEMGKGHIIDMTLPTTFAPGWKPLVEPTT